MKSPDLFEQEGDVSRKQRTSPQPVSRRVRLVFAVIHLAVAAAPLMVLTGFLTLEICFLLFAFVLLGLAAYASYINVLTNLYRTMLIGGALELLLITSSLVAAQAVGCILLGTSAFFTGAVKREEPAHE